MYTVVVISFLGMWELEFETKVECERAAARLSWVAKTSPCFQVPVGSWDDLKEGLDAAVGAGS